MLKLGLTGGIGSGKSLVSDYFLRLGIAIVDADIVAREIVEPGGSVLQAISEHFGTHILQPNGHLDRAVLRAIIFSSQEEKAWLEGLMHPAIREQISSQLNQSPNALTMLVSPLLLETDQHKMVDKIIVVDVPEQLQVKRAAQRDAVSEQQIVAIMNTQLPRDQRLQAADKIIDNSGPIVDTHKQCQALFDEFTKEIAE